MATNKRSTLDQPLLASTPPSSLSSAAATIPIRSFSDVAFSQSPRLVTQDLDRDVQGNSFINHRRHTETPVPEDEDDEEAEQRSKVPLRCRCCCGGFRLSRRKYILLISSILAVSFTILILVGLYAIVPVILKSQLSRSTLGFNDIRIVGTPTNASFALHSGGSIGNVLNMKAELGEMMLKVYSFPSNSSSLTRRLERQSKLQSSSLLSSIVSSSSSIESDRDAVADEPDFIELGEMLFPSLTLHGPSDFDVDTQFDITNLNALESWMSSILSSDTVYWHVEGRVSVRPYIGAIPLPWYSGITFSKTVAVIGCGGFKDVELIDFDMTASTAEHLYVMANISIYNPSRFGIDPLGDLHMDFFYNGIQQGTMRSVGSANAIVMKPAYNVYTFFGTLEPDPCCMQLTNELVQRYLLGLNSTLEARPNPKDGSSIELYNIGLSSLHLSTSLPGLPKGLISHVEVLSVSMAPSLTDRTIEFGMEVAFHIDSPLGPNAVMNVNSLTMDVEVSYIDVSRSPDPIPIGRLTMMTPATVRPRDPTKMNHTLEFVSLMAAPLAIQEPYENFLSFVTFFAQAPGQVEMRFRGLSNVSATYLYGEIDLVGLFVDIPTKMQGAQGMNQTEEKELNVIGNRVCTDEEYCGVDIKMIASIYNPSLLTMNMSDSTFDLYHNSSRLGSLSLTPFYLTPGPNPEVAAIGYLNPAQTDLAVMSRFMSGYVSKKNQTVELRGRQVNLTDPHLSAHDMTAAALSVQAECVGLEIQLLQNFQIQQFVIEFHRTPDVATGATIFSLTSSARVGASIVLPPSLQLPMQLRSVAILFDVQTNSSISIGHLNVTRFPVEYVSGSTSDVILDFHDAHFNVTGPDAFGDFASAMIRTSTVGIILDGYADPIADTNMGTLSLTNVHQKAEVELVGYNSFLAADGSSLLQVHSLDLLAAHKMEPSELLDWYSGGGSVDLSCNVSLQNPSQVAIRGLGLFEMDMYYEGVRMATVHLSNFSIELGLNIYAQNVCRGTFWNPVTLTEDGWRNHSIARRFLSNYLDGFMNEVTLTGRILQSDGSYRPGTDIPYLFTAFNTFETTCQVPGNTIPFIEELIVSVSWASAWKIIQNKGGIVPAKAKLFNPFSTSIIVTNMNLSVLAGNLSAPLGGWLVQELGVQPMYLPAHTQLTSPFMPVYLQWTPPVIACLLAIFLSANHSTGVSLVGGLNVWIDTNGTKPDPRIDFNQTMECAENLIPTTVVIPEELRIGSELIADVDVTHAIDDSTPIDSSPRDSVLDWIKSILWPTQLTGTRSFVNEGFCPIPVHSLPPHSLARQRADQAKQSLQEAV